ncbi:hypothetical protein Phum_PHUM604470 [Pediculus humanus corporis]|uniref:Uncharacterized protein n=1 Tax=Pediculus humanus subsp. corporis TaxID=121224 RepID=E0W3G0_PEDHC|nr:uncharacterized protein Phum_PHUM604470 [Pediculus humanus corporis]EEB20166.1 hypothetical protein Phum_PHUM604470 [Pediculus humanus corporis]
MNDNMKKYSFHILHIESNLVRNNSFCMYNRRARHRIMPYYMPNGRLVIVDNNNDRLHERTHTKSENSDTGRDNNELCDDYDNFVSPVCGLFRSKSLENINTSKKGQMGCCIF